MIRPRDIWEDLADDHADLRRWMRPMWDRRLTIHTHNLHFTDPRQYDCRTRRRCRHCIIMLAGEEAHDGCIGGAEEGERGTWERKKNVTIANDMPQAHLNISFRWTLIENKCSNWLHLLERLMGVSFSGDEDVFRWGLSTTGVCSVKSVIVDI